MIFFFIHSFVNKTSHTFFFLTSITLTFFAMIVGKMQYKKTRTKLYNNFLLQVFFLSCQKNLTVDSSKTKMVGSSFIIKLADNSVCRFI